MSTNPVDNPVHDAAVESPIGEWAVGDDELAALEVLGSGAEDGEGEPSGEQCSCPVCGTGLTGVLVLVSAPNRRCYTVPLTFAIPRLGSTNPCQSMPRYDLEKR